MKPVVIVLIKNSDRYLLVRRAHHKEDGGLWAPPSGKVEPGETPARAAVREMKEELGVDIVLIRKLHEKISDSGKYDLHFWEAEIKSGSPALASQKENSAFKWLTLEEIDRLEPTYQGAAAQIRALVKNN